MRETETDTQSIMGRGQGLEGWSSCWEEKADILEKPRQSSVLVPKGAGRPITQISFSETSSAGFALNSRGKLGSHALALESPNPLAGLWSLGTDYGALGIPDSVCSMLE